jgi:hypothetical protein
VAWALLASQSLDNIDRAVSIEDIGKVRQFSEHFDLTINFTFYLS